MAKEFVNGFVHFRLFFSSRGAELKIQHLWDRCTMIGSAFNLLLPHAENTVIASYAEQSSKGNLAVMSLANGIYIFSDIEMFDLDNGRFALGGFDGNKMVPSIKELDPPGMMEKLIKEKLL
ncbi:hypothetical protein JHK87_006187 [Glycine soja]|nr:hypothetical protein JHK87_006187 [Glycine soja]